MLRLFLVLRLVPFEDRVSTLFQWLSLPEEQRSMGFITATDMCRVPGRHGSCCCFRPDFYSLYLEEPDASGHRYGPTSSEVRRSLLEASGGRRVGSKFSLGLKGSDVTGCRCAFRWSRLWKKLMELWELWWTSWSREACCTVSTWSSSRITVSSQKHRFKKNKRFCFFFFLILLFFIQNSLMLSLCATGMEEASCQRGVFVSEYLNNSDDFSIIQGAAVRIRPSRLPENFFSCEFSRNAAQRCSVAFICDHRPSVFLLSQLRGPGERAVGMPTIPNGSLVFLSGMKDELPASLSLSLITVCCVCVCVLKCRTANQSMTPYLKENLPKRLHFAYNNRIERGHLYMKSGWQAALWVSAATDIQPKWGEKKNTKLYLTKICQTDLKVPVMHAWRSNHLIQFCSLRCDVDMI